MPSTRAMPAPTARLLPSGLWKNPVNALVRASVISAMGVFGQVISSKAHFDPVIIISLHIINLVWLFNGSNTGVKPSVLCELSCVACVILMLT